MYVASYAKVKRLLKLLVNLNLTANYRVGDSVKFRKVSFNFEKLSFNKQILSTVYVKKYGLEDFFAIYNY